MVYKDRVQQLLETLNGKVTILERYFNGALQLTQQDINKVLSDIKQLNERISNLIDNER
jgi:uncharacterized protein YukE